MLRNILTDFTITIMNNKYQLPRDGGLIEEAAPRDIIHRREKIRTQVFDSEYRGVQHVADIICRMIRSHEQSAPVDDMFDEGRPFVLGLTTGRTPLGLYRELVRRYRAGAISFAGVAVYSLDEFYPIARSEQQSRNYRIHEDFLNHIDILPENIHIPDGTVSLDRVSEYCAAFDQDVRNIDLMIIGMGEQGQIGFNEPGSYVRSHTRLVELTHNSRKVQSSLFFGLENTPKMAITMGLDTVMRADRIILMAWGEQKADAVQRVVEGEITDMVPASHLQQHPDIEVVIDENAARLLTREQTPWLVGPCRWTPKFIRKAVVWLCGVVDKPILKLTYLDYIENSLGELLERTGQTYDRINIDVFNDLQHTITGWPGGKPDADDSTRPAPSQPYPKRVLIFSPHPDDDVISMGGTFIRLVEQGHDVHVAYETSGNVAVHDDVVVQNVDTAREMGMGDHNAEMLALIASKRRGEPEPRRLLDIKGAIRRAEARAAVRSFGLNPDTNAHFLNMPFYETGGIKKGQPHLHGGSVGGYRHRPRRRLDDRLPPMALSRRMDGVGSRNGRYGRTALARRDVEKAPRDIPPPIAEGHSAVPGQRHARILAESRGAHAEHSTPVRQAGHGRISGHRGVRKDVLKQAAASRAKLPPAGRLIRRPVGVCAPPDA